MADLPRALDRLMAALAAGETIGVFGDYDVDGVTTAAVLTLALRACGGRVLPRAASRHAGYGLGVGDVERFAGDGCRVLVTGDCGTSDHDALAGGARARHRRHRHRPPRAARGRDRRRTRWSARADPTTRSRSRGWRRAASRSTSRRRCAPGWAAAFDPRDLLDLVALGTIADMVPLVDENRILVAAGLHPPVDAQAAGGRGAGGARRARVAGRSPPPTSRFA